MSREFIWTLFRAFGIFRDALAFAVLPDPWKHMAARTRLLRKARKCGASVGANVEVITLERLRLGSGTVVQSNVTLHCGGMDWTGSQGEICIGRNSFIGHGCVLYGAGGIRIGDDALISPGVIFASHQHAIGSGASLIRLQPSSFASISVEANVWIGSGAVILPGVTLGYGCIVAAGAVVSRSVPPQTLVAGVPARIVKTLRESGEQVLPS